MSDMQAAAAALPEVLRKYGDEHGFDDAQRVTAAMHSLARLLGYIANFLDYGDKEDAPGERVTEVRNELSDATELAQALVLPIGRERTIRLLTTVLRVDDHLAAGQFVAKDLEREGDADPERLLREKLREAVSFHAIPLRMHESELLAIVKLDFSGVKLPDDDRWSEPATHKTWEKRFGVKERTLRDWRDKGFRMEKVPMLRGMWRVHRDEDAYKQWEESQE